MANPPWHEFWGEEAPTFPDWFKSDFRYCLTLPPIIWRSFRWGDSTISRLIQVWFLSLSNPQWHEIWGEEAPTFPDWFKSDFCKCLTPPPLTWILRWESSDISRLIQVWFLLLSNPPKHEVWDEESLTFPDWFKSHFYYCLTLLRSLYFSLCSLIQIWVNLVHPAPNQSIVCLKSFSGLNLLSRPCKFVAV